MERAAEFSRDVGRLVLPELFSKWGASGDARVEHRLNSLSIAAFDGAAWNGVDEAGAPVLHQGVYRDPDLGPADWKNSWRRDPVRAALHDDLAALRVSRQRAEALIATDRQQRNLVAERERLAEQQRQDAYHPAPVTYERVAPALTAQEREGHSSPPPEVTGRTIGPHLG